MVSMRNWILYILPLAIFGASFSSCEKEIDVDLPPYTPSLVVMSRIQPDSVFSVFLSNSVSILDGDEPEEVTDATVEILNADGQVIATLEDEEDIGFYRGGELDKPRIGATYHLRIAAEDYPSVSASAICPEPVPILEVIRTDILGVDGAGRPTRELTMTFQDDPAERNYYQLALYEADTAFLFGDTSVFLTRIFFELANGNLTNRNSYEDGWMFTDDFFNGNEHTLRMEAEESVLGDSTANLYVFLATVSEDYYRYRLSAARLDEINPFSEPAQLHNNIEGGVGIFSGISVDKKVVPD